MDTDIECSQCGGGPATEAVDTIIPCCRECWDALIEREAQEYLERVETLHDTLERQQRGSDGRT